MQLLLRTHRDCINCLITNKYLKKNNYIYTKKEEKKKERQNRTRSKFCNIREHVREDVDS